MPAAVFPAVVKVAMYILTMFCSTYSCESAFSTMNIIKTKYKSKITNDYLHACWRIAQTPFLLRFKMLAGKIKDIFPIKKVKTVKMRDI